MSVFKIPKRSRSDSEAESLQMTSPLSRLQTQHNNNNNNKSFSPFSVRSLSGNNSSRNQHRSDLSSRLGDRAQPFTNGWRRPKRASDRLLFPPVSPKQQKHEEEGPGSPEDSPVKTSSAKPDLRPISVRSSSSSSSALASLRAQRHHGSSGQDTPTAAEQDTPTTAERVSSWCKVNSDPPASTRDKPAPASTRDKPALASKEKPALASTRDKPAPAQGWFDLSDVREKQRQKWRLFKEKKQQRSQAVIRDQDQDQDRHKHRSKAKTTTDSEPIVLSSEEEEEQSDVIRTRRQLPDSAFSRLTPPPFLTLDFRSFHLGLSRAEANGQITITESGITVPLRGSDGEEAELCVVANQVRAFGLWDGGLARGGTLFSDPAHSPSGPAPSLLFLSVTDAQSKLLQTELREILPGNTDPLCPLLLLVLKDQLSDLDSALVLSVLDSEDYRRSRSGSGSGSGSGLGLDWAHGLVLVHSCPPPVDAHLLQLLGQSSSVVRTRTGLRSAAQTLPSRLIVYPPAPSKGRISVTSEDLQCLKHGEFLNDVIIDFYLKYLLLEGVGGAVAQRSHIFSSFFYKQLSKRRAAGEENGNIPDRHTRHRRVRTWTRNVDIFNKDFLFIPVNQESHWFLVLVCFPGLQQSRQEEFSPSTEFVRPGFGLRSQTPPECTLKGCRRNTVFKRPCVLVMDSLKLSQHDSVSRLIRDYLTVEWEQRRGSKRLFSPETFKTFSCRVPQQDNSSDCGVFLLQYTQVFLQNPVVTFEPPVRLETWFPRQQVRDKREEIKDLILRLHREQDQD